MKVNSPAGISFLRIIIELIRSSKNAIFDINNESILISFDFSFWG
jgi:hypothetical protein